MGHQAVWNSHPKNYGPGSRTCRVCGNCHGMIRKYNINCCRQCFRIYSKDIGFVKVSCLRLETHGQVSFKDRTMAGSLSEAFKPNNPITSTLSMAALDGFSTWLVVSLRAGMPGQALGYWAEEPRSKNLMIWNVMRRRETAGQAVAE
eukprot:SM000004S14967  [mRNA]  locus=s4:516456:517856:+ [translate_table: standard]